MRTLLGIGLVVALFGGAGVAGAARQDAKIDGKKLVGKWEPAKPKAGEKMVMEFTKDGKLIVTGDMGGKELKLEGTYKLDGNKLSFAINFMGTEIKETVTITKLTDDEMEGEDKDKKAEAFKRIKEDKKEEKKK
ncbi:MAG: TIGR03066 family protein [Gemmataceae bacterium]|nr:TIGR03066 family protein [Gemmataceae bacterium]